MKYLTALIIGVTLLGIGINIYLGQKNLLAQVAQGQFGVVYSTNTGRIRSIITASNPKDLDSLKLLKGEAMLKLDNSSYGDLPNLQSQVSKQTGLIPSSDEYAEVDAQGNVVGSIIADPKIDTPPTGDSLIQSDVAGPGWKYRSGDFQAPTSTPSVTPTP